MVITVVCPKPGCAAVFKAEARLMGASVECPKCGGPVPVKASSTPAGAGPTTWVPPKLRRATARPKVSRLGASPALRWTAGLLVVLTVVAAAIVGKLMLSRGGEKVKVEESGPPPAPPLESPVVVPAPKPPEMPPVKPIEPPPPPPSATEQGAAAPAVVFPQPEEPKPQPKPVFDPLEYARDIGPVNDLIDCFQYPPAFEKTQGLAAKYDSTPEGRFLIKQKLLNIASLKELRAGAFSRVNNALVRIVMSDMSPDRDGVVVSADEQRLVSSAGGKKTELPWPSFKKEEVYIFYARSGAENDPAGHVSLAVFLMEGSYHSDLIAKGEQELQVAGMRGLDVTDPERYLNLLKSIQAALEKVAPPEAKAEPPKEKVKEPTKSPPNEPAGRSSHGEMVLVPAGEFTMGDDEMPNATPKRKVYLNAFYMDKYEVTNAEYMKFCRATGNNKPKHWQGGEMPRGRENYPVVGVVWDDALNYANWVGKRLPTEAEWEKAARGTDGRRFPWGNIWDSKKCNSGFRLAQYGFQPPGNERAWDTEWRRWVRTVPASILMEEGGATMPVASFPEGASPYGCMDMAGNAAELCMDGYVSDYYLTAPNRNPPGPGTAMYRVSRSGSWACYAKAVQCAYRGMASPGDANCFTGFRCARDAPRGASAP